MGIDQKLNAVSQCRSRRRNSFDQTSKVLLSLFQLVMMQVVVVRELRKRMDDFPRCRLLPLQSAIDPVDTEKNEQQGPKVGHGYDRHQPGNCRNGLFFFREQNHGQQGQCQDVSKNRNDCERRLHGKSIIQNQTASIPRNRTLRSIFLRKNRRFENCQTESISSPTSPGQWLPVPRISSDLLSLPETGVPKRPSAPPPSLPTVESRPRRT